MCPLPDYAVVVGVSDYPGLRDDAELPGAAEDAQRFHTWLLGPGGGGLSDANTHLIVASTRRGAPGHPGALPRIRSPLDAEPAAHQIQRAFRSLQYEWTRRNEAGQGSPLGRRLWVYFAGHGVSLVRPGEHRIPVLLTADARHSDAQHVAGELWAQWTARSCMFQELVVIIDACGVIVPNVPVVDPPGAPDFANQCVVFRATSAASPTAWEVMQPDGRPGGRFTSRLLTCLGAPRRTPLTAVDLYASLRADLGDTFSFTPAPYAAGEMVLSAAREVGPTEGRATSSSDALIHHSVERNERSPSEVLRPSTLATLSMVRSVATERGDVVLVGRCAPGSSSPLKGWAIIDANGRICASLDAVCPTDEGTFLARWRIVGALFLGAGIEGDRVVETTALRVLRPRGDDPVIMAVDLTEDLDLVSVLCRASLFTRDFTAHETRAALETLASLEPECAAGANLTVPRLRADLQTLGADPIACLLIAILAAGLRAPELAREALERCGLGADDPDVAALSGGSAGDGLPRFATSWQARIDTLARELDAENGGDLDERERAISGRRIACLPWLAWFGEAARAPWEVWVANAHWPGWDNGRWQEPVPPPPPSDPGRVTRLLEAAPADWRGHLYKRPPVKALASADRVSFVGATNDQLAAAIVSAFQLRDRRRWEELELFFLDDDPLATLVSDGRTGAALVRDRNVAQAILEPLLPHVATCWTMSLSPQRYEEDTFASLWDLEDEQKAWVHFSRYDGKDLRTSKGTDVTMAEEPAVVAEWRMRVKALREGCRVAAGSPLAR